MEGIKAKYVYIENVKFFFIEQGTMSGPTHITAIEIKDIRFPTSLDLDGSDAMVTLKCFCWYSVIKYDDIILKS